MDKNEREKEFLYQLKIGEMDDILQNFELSEGTVKSLFVSSPKRAYLMEYDFETAPQLKVKLDALWEDEECMQAVKKTVLVAAMKNKPSKTEVKKEQEKEIREQMPAFIYNF